MDRRFYESYLTVRLYFFSMILLFLGNSITNSQTVNGRLVDENGNGLSGLQLKLYANLKSYDAQSGAGGAFTYNNLTEVKNLNVPSGYSVADNYPNPFNPKTRIGFTLPDNGSVRIDLFNMLGQKIIGSNVRYFSAGTNFIDLELNGLSNGIYLARVTRDENILL